MLTRTFRPEAGNDIDDLAAYIGQHNTEAGERFIEAVDLTAQRLCSRPGFGHTRPDLPPGYRALRVRGFDRVLMVYRYDERRVTVVRVLDGARDFDALFAAERNR